MYQINELNDYIWMQVQQNEDQIIHLMIFLGLFNCETEGSIHWKDKDRLNIETETARSYSSKQNFFLKMHKET